MLFIPSAAVGTFAVAWVMTKFTEPLRMATTVVIVPPIARYWSRLTAAKEAKEAEEAEAAAADADAARKK